MKKVNLNEVNNFKGVRKGSTKANLNSIPKKGIKQLNDRVKTAENVKNGTIYSIPVYTEINVGTSGVAYLELQLKLTNMIKVENSNYIVIIEEETLGAFVTSFDNLRVGKFERIIDEQLTRHFNNIAEVRHEYDDVIKNKNEEIKLKEHQLGRALTEKQEFQLKYADEWNAHENTKDTLNNTLMVVEQQKNEIVTLKEELKDEKQKNMRTVTNFDKMTWRSLIKIIGISYSKGESTDKIYERIMRYLEK